MAINYSACPTIDRPCGHCGRPIRPTDAVDLRGNHYDEGEVPPYAPCATCTMPAADRHHDPAYRMHRTPYDIPRHPYTPSR